MFMPTSLGCSQPWSEKFLARDRVSGEMHNCSKCWEGTPCSALIGIFILPQPSRRLMKYHRRGRRKNMRAREWEECREMLCSGCVVCWYIWQLTMIVSCCERGNEKGCVRSKPAMGKKWPEGREEERSRRKEAIALPRVFMFGYNYGEKIQLLLNKQANKPH